MNFDDELSILLTKRESAPFLFVGSGFSRRYLGLDDWDGLLSKFCLTGKPYQYFKSSANQDTRVAARLLSEEFYDLWWTNVKYKKKRDALQHLVVDRTSPLRLSISEHLKESSTLAKANPVYKQELELLKKCDVDGIITTNWDLFLEELFPKYKVYIGQKELLFSNTLSHLVIHKCSVRQFPVAHVSFPLPREHPSIRARSS